MSTTSGLEDWETNQALKRVGEVYQDFRAGAMLQLGEGLTKLYNHFHDPHQNAPEVVTLRNRHVDMDRAVLEAYGWRDIPTDLDFLLDHEIDEQQGWGARKERYRHRWPDEVRDEVLARLVELNAQRAAEETSWGRATGARGR